MAACCYGRSPASGAASGVVPSASTLGHAAWRFGRCVACDDVVAKLGLAADGPELAVIHLTWKGPIKEPAWPYFTRVTTPAFVERFLRGGEHL